MLHQSKEKRKRLVLIEDPVSEPAKKISKGDEFEEILDYDLEPYTREQEDRGDDEDEDFSEGESLLNISLPKTHAMISKIG